MHVCVSLFSLTVLFTLIVRVSTISRPQWAVLFQIIKNLKYEKAGNRLLKLSEPIAAKELVKFGRVL